MKKEFFCMNRCTVIDMNSWPRKEMFAFYQQFDTPCFNISVEYDASAIYRKAKEQGESFFMMSLYAILRAANFVPQIRQRIAEDGSVHEYEQIAVMTPVMTHDEMFRQVWCEYAPTFERFLAENNQKIIDAKAGKPAPMTEHGQDFLCASCLPWLHFKSITQAKYTFSQSTPILAWGKMDRNAMVPISCQFNHALVDGLHVSRFFGRVEEFWAEPEKLFEPVVFSAPSDRR